MTALYIYPGVLVNKATEVGSTLEIFKIVSSSLVFEKKLIPVYYINQCDTSYTLMA